MKLLLVSTLAATAAAATNHTLRGRDLAKGGVQGANPWKRCDALVESMNNLEGMVLLLQNQLDLLVDGMSTIIEDVDTKIDYMSNEMDLHLGSVVDGISSLIADDMSTLIGDVDTKVNAISTSVGTDLQAKVTDLLPKVNDIFTSVGTGLGAKVDVVSTSIGMELKTKVDSITTSIDAIVPKVDSITPLIGGVDIKVDGISTSVGLLPSLQSQMTGLSTSLTNLKQCIACTGTQQRSDITLDVESLDDWVQAPYSGALEIVVAEGLKLSGTATRNGNALLSRGWYNMIGATLYMKWKVTPNSYSNYHIGTVAQSAGYFTSNHIFDGSTQVTTDKWMYTMIEVGEDGTHHSQTSYDKYADQPDSGTLLLDNIEALPSLKVESLKAIQLLVGLNDNYEGAGQSITLGEAKIMNTYEVAKPVNSISVYSGEDVIPVDFITSSAEYDKPEGTAICNSIWSIDNDNGNAIKGSLTAGTSTTRCHLTLPTYNAAGISFSIKSIQTPTNIGSNIAFLWYGYDELQEQQLFGFGFGANGSSGGYHSIDFPIPESVAEVFFKVQGNTELWIKDINLLYN